MGQSPWPEKRFKPLTHLSLIRISIISYIMNLPSALPSQDGKTSSNDMMTQSKRKEVRDVTQWHQKTIDQSTKLFNIQSSMWMHTRVLVVIASCCCCQTLGCTALDANGQWTWWTFARRSSITTVVADSCPHFVQCGIWRQAMMSNAISRVGVSAATPHHCDADIGFRHSRFQVICVWIFVWYLSDIFKVERSWSLSYIKNLSVAFTIMCTCCELFFWYRSWALQIQKYLFNVKRIDRFQRATFRFQNTAS